MLSKMETEIKVKKKVDITEEDFKAYEKVRVSGVTNMMMVTTVGELSGLDKEKVIAIIENYETLMKEYPNVRD